MIRVLIVDDSALVRRTLVEILTRDPEVEVVDTAGNGADAIAKIRRLRPDVVTLDVMMPQLDGLKVLAHVMRENPVRVLMLSSLTQEGAETTLHALELGAVDFVDKAALALPPEDGSLGGELLAKIHAIAKIDLSRLGRYAARAVKAGTIALGPSAAGADIVIVGTSTGGPTALQQLIPALPASLPASVVVVQHIPRGFTGPLADRLNAMSALTVREAAEGDIVRPGEVSVAPGGVHLKFCRRGETTVIVLDPEPSDSLLRPSVDVTMKSAAEIWGNRAVGVLLTGMGNDGTLGMRVIRSKGGRTLAESEESCVVYGMPKAAVDLGVVDEVLPLDRMAERIAAAVRPSPGGAEQLPLAGC